MSNKKKSKVYIKKSTVPELGQGLFASENIKKGLIIAEFKGKRKPTCDADQSKCNIYFGDNTIIECFPDNPASHAKDIINFSREKRNLVEALKSDKPLYKKHKNTRTNANIKIYETTHRAFLVASRDIEKDSEIFFHYGFDFWFQTEGMFVGFLHEQALADQNYTINEIYKYPGFISYVHEFYEDVVLINHKENEKGNVDVIYCHKYGDYTVLQFKKRIKLGIVNTPIDDHN